MQTGSEIIKDLLDLGILVTWAVWMLQWKCNTHQSAAVKYQQLQTDAGWQDKLTQIEASPQHPQFHWAWLLCTFMQNIQLNWN